LQFQRKFFNNYGVLFDEYLAEQAQSGALLRLIQENREGWFMVLLCDHARRLGELGLHEEAAEAWLKVDPVQPPGATRPAASFEEMGCKVGWPDSPQI
jgi:hypothetical protein